MSVGDTFVLSEGNKFKATLTLVSLDQESAKLPKIEKDARIIMPTSFADAIAEVKDFADIDGRFPNRRGVRLEFGKKLVTCCACRGQFAVRLSTPCICGDLTGKSAIVAQESIDMLVEGFRFYQNDAFVTLDDSLIIFEFPSINTKERKVPACTLICSQPEIDSTNRQERLDYAAMFVEMLSANSIEDSSFFPAPEGFGEAVSRCHLVKDNTDATSGARLRTKGDTMFISGKGAQGKVLTRLKMIKAGIDVTTEIEPSRLSRIAGLSDKVALGKEDVMAFVGTRFKGIMFYYDSNPE